MVIRPNLSFAPKIAWRKGAPIGNALASSRSRLAELLGTSTLNRTPILRGFIRPGEFH